MELLICKYCTDVFLKYFTKVYRLYKDVNPKYLIFKYIKKKLKNVQNTRQLH